MFAEPHPPTFDWSHGRAIVAEGTIYYSPNCSRPPVIPPPQQAYHSTTPFPKNREVTLSEFKQPVWWNINWGWLSFVPLAPSFISLPFEPLCWTPRIREVCRRVKSGDRSGEIEKRYQMREDDALVWHDREELLVRCAQVIRERYKIHGTAPPKPSSFGYCKTQESSDAAKRIIGVARDWFVIWMGFLSYLLAQSQSQQHNWVDRRSKSPVPLWYEVLVNEGYNERWLNALLASSVGDFSLSTPRAGVVIDWTRPDNTRPLIRWFFDLDIPLWFPWTSLQEETIRQNGSWSFLRPPQDLLQEALNAVFAVPNIPLCALVMQQFSRKNLEMEKLDKALVEVLRLKYATSFVFDYVTKWYLRQIEDLPHLDNQESRDRVADDLQGPLSAQRDRQRAEAWAAASIPFQGMIERDEVHGQLFNTWQTFFARRDKREDELMLAETPDERNRRLARQRCPPTTKTDMFMWSKIVSSGGKIIFARTKVNKGNYSNLLESHPPSQRRYSAFANEWDFFEGFAREGDKEGSNEYTGYIQSDTEGDDGDEDTLDFDYEHPVPYSVPLFSPTSPDPVPRDQSLQEAIPQTLDSPMQTTTSSAPGLEVALASDSPSVEDAIPKPYDIFDKIGLMYGFVTPVTTLGGTALLNPRPWIEIQKALGFMEETELTWTQQEKTAIANFISRLLDPSAGLAASQDDLNSATPTVLASAFDFTIIHRPHKNLYIFETPRSPSSTWSLGIESAPVALYICRLIFMSSSPTILTIAHQLLQRNIPFCTLVLRQSPDPHCLDTPFAPRSYRFANHQFTVEDFENSMLECRYRLGRPYGRAAFLQGGILGRIAREFGSKEAALEGPSVEVTAHNSGRFWASSNPEEYYWDDGLTEDDIACFCGTYRLYTGRGEQKATVSWFPHPRIWQGSGHDWIEWTERNEDWDFYCTLFPQWDGPPDPVAEAKFSLDCTVGDEGANFSAGEKQLLALCRALVKNSKIIVLDEATSSVDVETDAKLQRTIQTEFASSTLLCIAHRLNTIAYYDRVLVMDDGKVVEYDTVLNLFDKEDSIFRSLCDEANLQRSDISDELHQLPSISLIDPCSATLHSAEVKTLKANFSIVIMKPRLSAANVWTRLTQFSGYRGGRMTPRRPYSTTRLPEYYEGHLEGTVNHHRCYILLHADEPPSAFPSVFHTPVSRELLARATKWGGMVNFSWLNTPLSHSDVSSPRMQSATVFSTLGGRLEISDVSLDNVDEVEARIRAHLDGPVAESTSDEVHVYVCTHGARDCRCGERGRRVFEALAEEVESLRRADPTGPAAKIKVGEIGHVGGHKYAANALIFPHGEWLGCIKPEDASPIIKLLCDDLKNGNVKPRGPAEEPFSLRHWRGRMGMTKEEQKHLWESFALKDSAHKLDPTLNTATLSPRPRS
ncbi:hypothetical protein NLJ89_g5746 [Agrocybe chaxingu]|uniref:ABC transporter domain-containing protein n=1 Tax=Agrocybe chaxingu TaxID=84603 RepID=A0A9W8K002_9AGAR|nr:hypothetical protein NLJ89_g5746 [Agrocybe chaxingu]